MHTIRALGSPAWRRIAFLMGMTFSSAACAQQNGFFVYPAEGGQYGKRIEVLAGTCKGYDIKKAGRQEVSCTFTSAPAKDQRSPIVLGGKDAAREAPEVLVFNQEASGCWCSWGPKGYVCSPPSCR